MKAKYFLLFLLLALRSIRATGQSTIALATGKALFVKHCIKCHGPDGTKGYWGAKNLRKSKLGDEGLFKTVSNGRWIMPAWKETLSRAEISSVISYVKTLRD